LTTAQATSCRSLTRRIPPIREAFGRSSAGQAAYVHFTLEKAAQVTITVFNLAGDIVNVLTRAKQDPGEHTTAWDGKNRGGRPVARGIYFVRVVGPGFDEIRKVLLVR
jgi:flagellar hook assembly protein FlgD